MAKTYKQRIYDDLETILEKYPHAKASDVFWCLEMACETLWRSLPAPREGRKVLERTKRYRVA